LYGKEGEGETVQQIGRGEGGGGKATQGERGSRRRPARLLKRTLLTWVRR